MKIGIDIGGSHIASGIVSDKGLLIDKVTRDISSANIKTENQAQKLILKTIDEEIEELLEKNNYHIKKFEIAKILKEKYGAEVKLKNDGKCAGVAEKKFGALKQYDNCIFLCIGTGVGSAVFYNGRLLQPKNYPGFEFGHMIINKNGNKCKCGKKGCFETYASMKKFKNSAIKKLNLKKNIESDELQKYLRKEINSDKVKQFIDEYIDNLSIGISNIINIFEPEAICFGGSFSYYEDIFLPRLKVNLKKYVFNKDSKYDLICAELKNDAGIIGAVEL